MSEQLRAAAERALNILDSEFTTAGGGDFCAWCDGRLGSKHQCELESTVKALRSALAAEQAQPVLSRIWFWPGGWIVSQEPVSKPREDATPVTGAAEGHFFRLHSDESARILERTRCPVIGCTATTPHVHATAYTSPPPAPVAQQGEAVEDPPVPSLGLLSRIDAALLKAIREKDDPFAPARSAYDVVSLALAEHYAQQTAVPLTDAAHAIELLVAAGHITRAKADEALQLAAKHGIGKESSDAAK